MMDSCFIFIFSGFVLVVAAAFLLRSGRTEIISFLAGLPLAADLLSRQRKTLVWRLIVGGGIRISPPFCYTPLFFFVDSILTTPFFFCALLPQELGAEVVRVLLRNTDLFRIIAGAGAVEDEAGRGEGSLGRRSSAEAAGEAVVAEKSRTAGALSLATPGGPGGMNQGVLDGAPGEMRQGTRGAVCCVCREKMFC